MELFSLTNQQIEQLISNARNSPRKRAHFNVHKTLDANVQKLFIATEPETYIRPHRHPEAHKWELFTVLRGKIDLLIFNDSGAVTQRIPMSAQANSSVEIPANVWHTYVCQQSGTLALEVKEGAYIPTTEENFAPWSPQENSPKASEYRETLRNQ